MTTLLSSSQLLTSIVSVVLLCLLTVNAPLRAQEASAPSAEASSDTRVMQAFADRTSSDGVLAIEDHTKHLVMFIMGLPLLLLLLVTAGLGIAMGIYGKPVFVAHMIFAGLSLTLAIAHAVVGIVWFYPF